MSGTTAPTETRERPKNVFTRAYLALGQRSGRRMFEEVKGASSLKPRLSVSKVVAAVVAVVVHSLTLLFVAGGVFMLARARNPGYVIVGLMLLALAWATRPRLGKAPNGVVPTADIRHLAALVERVRGELGGPRVTGILLPPDFNASVRRVGWRRRTYLSVGLPLLAVLSPQERVAVLGHEMAHLVNGDPRRGGFIGSAFGTLTTWHALLRPNRAAASRAGGIAALAAMVANSIVALLAGAVRWIAVGLIHLMWHDSQRAEYLADNLGRQVAGTDAMASMLAKLPLETVFQQAVHTMTLNPQQNPNLFEDFRRRVVEDTGTDGDRARTKQRAEGFRLDATHPPGAYRIEFLRAKTVPAKLTLTQGESDAIDRELQPYEARSERRILDEYRSRLYR